MYINNYYYIDKSTLKITKAIYKQDHLKFFDTNNYNYLIFQPFKEKF